MRPFFVIPAEAGVQLLLLAIAQQLDPRLRGGDALARAL
jgi:hypothetical protein